MTIDPIPLLFKPLIGPKDINVAGNFDYHKMKIC